MLKINYKFILPQLGLFWTQEIKLFFQYRLVVIACGKYEQWYVWGFKGMVIYNNFS